MTTEITYLFEIMATDALGWALIWDKEYHFSEVNEPLEKYHHYRGIMDRNQELKLTVTKIVKVTGKPDVVAAGIGVQGRAE